MERLTVLQSVCQLLQNKVGFLSLKTQKILSNVKKDELEEEAYLFVKETCSLYKACFEYLLK
jgi:hypothetical protein